MRSPASTPTTPSSSRSANRTPFVPHSSVQRAVDAGIAAPSTWHPDRLEELIRTERIDRVVITARDDLHAPLIVRALDAGVDVVVEKPLTIDAESAAAIEDAVAAHRRRRAAHVQLPLLAPQQRAATGHPGRPHRRGHLDRFPVDARHQARRGLLPPLAPREEELRRPARAQGQPPLRPRQLVDPLDPAARLRLGWPALLRRGERRRPRHLGERPERGTHDGAPTASISTCARTRT